MEPSTGVHQFSLTDARGVEHQYLVTEHPAGEGMDIMYALLGLGAPTVLGLAGAAMKSEDLLGGVMRVLAGGDSGVGDTKQLGQMFSALDLGAVGSELGRALGSGRAPDLTRRVLSRVHRDSKPLNIDLAYQANYGEMLQAVWKVCTINRFFPVPSTSSSTSGDSTREKSQLPVA